ncbi:MAG: FIG00907047: phosphodiesterase/nucleotide pyrophosphatase [uncultured Cytophagales bacterium]|uniref:FIG00907047: phosphodiesterase/nucleotide pyrophosphatase n=1 Tax=uncultured Cytophagales bacterium TaxID=158755 RepID=A0A6J4I685_9SPHI|nr:MAG: FIG00907047: phosphodiesterase/nucleotide pyrophosphatase [uncultured Cytophagales bacterium]
MQKTVVLNVVGLTPRLIGEHTPFLKQWSARGHVAAVEPVLPAVTCSVQATYLTGKTPAEHGVVANGWYFRDECEIKLWRQSNRLVQAPKIWEVAKQRDPSFTCANMFWWFNMYSTADYAVTPRPQYLADGRKLPDCYSQPMALRERLQAELGTFPLFEFWGPRTTIRSSRWIADASMLVDRWHNPTLTLVYLPHLDYNIQRFGLDFAKIGRDLGEIDAVCADLIRYYEGQGARVVVLSEYGITNVNRPVDINRVLRKHGYISVREERGTELPDVGTSAAFALADHQLAHVYVNDRSKLGQIRQLLENTEGIEMVLDEEGKKKHHLDHERSGELVAVADARSWFTYYYWLDDRKAPDFARVVDIHKKPGYDPVEMFADPNIKLLPLKVGMKLAKKKLGFRMLMDIIPLDGTLVRGSHGRYPDDPADGPLFITRHAEPPVPQRIRSTQVFDLLLSHLQVHKNILA